VLSPDAVLRADAKALGVAAAYQDRGRPILVPEVRGSRRGRARVPGPRDRRVAGAHRRRAWGGELFFSQATKSSYTRLSLTANVSATSERLL